jgi:hypothetical protein
VWVRFRLITLRFRASIAPWGKISRYRLAISGRKQQHERMTGCSCPTIQEPFSSDSVSDTESQSLGATPFIGAFENTVFSTWNCTVPHPRRTFKRWSRVRADLQRLTRDVMLSVD